MLSWMTQATQVVRGESFSRWIFVLDRLEMLQLVVGVIVGQFVMSRVLVRLRFQLADGVTEAVLTVSDAVLAAADESESLATTTATLTVVNGTVQHG